MNQPPVVRIHPWAFHDDEDKTIDHGVIIRTNRTQIYIPHDQLVAFADFMIDTYEN